MKLLLLIGFFCTTALTVKCQSLTVSPNPLSNKAEISYSIATGDTASIFILNTLGQNVDTVLFKTYLNPGIYADSIFTSLLPHGIYFIVLQLKSGSATVKFIKLDAPTGISGNSLPDIKLYPIPITDYLNIDFTKMQISTLTITNSLGRIIYSSNNSHFLEQIDFRGLPAGIYFVRFSNTNESKTYKVIKEYE